MSDTLAQVQHLVLPDKVQVSDHAYDELSEARGGTASGKPHPQHLFRDPHMRLTTRAQLEMMAKTRLNLAGRRYQLPRNCDDCARSHTLTISCIEACETQFHRSYAAMLAAFG